MAIGEAPSVLDKARPDGKIAITKRDDRFPAIRLLLALVSLVVPNGVEGRRRECETWSGRVRSIYTRVSELLRRWPRASPHPHRSRCYSSERQRVVLGGQ